MWFSSQLCRDITTRAQSVSKVGQFSSRQDRWCARWIHYCLSIVCFEYLIPLFSLVVQVPLTIQEGFQQICIFPANQSSMNIQPGSSMSFVIEKTIFFYLIFMGAGSKWIKISPLSCYCAIFHLKTRAKVLWSSSILIVQNYFQKLRAILIKRNFPGTKDKPTSQAPLFWRPLV